MPTSDNLWHLATAGRTFPKPSPTLQLQQDTPRPETIHIDLPNLYPSERAILRDSLTAFLSNL